MSLLKKLFSSTNSTPPQKSLPQDNSEGCKVANDPVLFANWVNKYIILSVLFERDFSSAPDDEQCKRLNISNKERTLCANEYVLLRTLGACLFVRKNLDEHYYLTFRDVLLPPVIERMKRHAPYNYYDNPSDALDQYMEEFKSDSHVGLSMTYLIRVYPDTPSSGSLFLNGIPIEIALKYTMGIFEIVRNGYSTLLTGLEYNTLEKLHNILNEGESKG